MAIGNALRSNSVWIDVLSFAAATFVLVFSCSELDICLASQTTNMPCCVNDTGGLITVEAGTDGRLVVQRTGGLFEAFERSGQKLWAVNLTSDYRLSVYGFGVTPGNDVLVVGIRSGTRESDLYRISQDGRDVRLVRTYPDMVLCDVGAAPNGSVYLLAVSNVALELMRAPAANEPALNQTAGVERPVLHRLNENGEIVKSSYYIRIPTDSWQVAYEFLMELASHSLYFSESGQPYIMNSKELLLKAADLGDSIQQTPRENMSLSCDTTRGKPYISSFAFLTDDTVAYSLSFADQHDTIVGSEIRVQNITSGVSTQMVSGPANAISARIAVDRGSHTLAVYSAKEILANEPRAVWVIDFPTLVRGVQK